ncbi:MAG: AAA family ATPase, partial [Muribaculaceae bacterium]|nr:AAA family ATPase [Muribaculaceae bacterium]
MEKLDYPVSTANFERIRTEGFIYVDKTQYIYSLVSKSGFYFLSRPRRFGKSLLLSTIESYFLGKKELFKGLAIDNLKSGEWLSYPVLHLDLSGKAYVDKNSLTSLLDMHLQAWETEYGIGNPRQAVDERFNVVIETVAAKSGKKIVVLVDEYDSPLSDSIGNEELQELFRDQLHGFYSVLKKTEKHIQFCMLTGVTKFGKVSV